MVVFLVETREALVRSLYSSFAKKEVLLEANTVSKLVKVDVNDQKNLLSLHKVDLGFGIKYKLTQLKYAEKIKSKSINLNPMVVHF